VFGVVGQLWLSLAFWWLGVVHVLVPIGFLVDGSVLHQVGVIKGGVKYGASLVDMFTKSLCRNWLESMYSKKTQQISLKKHEAPLSIHKVYTKNTKAKKLKEPKKRRKKRREKHQDTNKRNPKPAKKPCLYPG
jgi:hypothetical protein